MICTFFGHKNIFAEIETTLRLTVTDLILNRKVDTFYVGNHGQFDSLVYKVLKDLRNQYIFNYKVVLAYMPSENDKLYNKDFSNTILPDGIEKVPKRFAIEYRNKWMINKSDIVVTYVINEIGSGAAKFKKIAQKRDKTVIEIS